MLVWKRSSYLTLWVTLMLATTPGIAAADEQTIVASGPIQSIDLGDDLGCQVGYVNDTDFEFFPPSTSPGDCGTFLAVDGTLYAPAFMSHGATATGGLGDFVPFDPVSQTGVVGSGSAADPYRVTTVVNASGSGLQVSETTSYVAGADSYQVTTTVENLTTTPTAAVLYHAGDCYASGSDIGFGFTRTEIGAAGCSQSANNSPAGRTIQMAPLSSGSHYYEGFYRDVWEQIATQVSLPDTCSCDEHIDNGVGLSWVLPIQSEARETRSLTVAFTETQQPAPGADSDGDALPDSWETGSAPSGGYQNLAPLGADPNRKDVFVHADYMAGCKPPDGWAQSAIQIFALHGIALHVDAGPDSINASYQPWNALSQAGEILHQPNLPIWGDAFDRLKDTHFIGSDRRRAFHYMVFIDKFTAAGREYPTGGQSRGFGDADFVVATCHDPGLQGVDRKRWTTGTFVHELGHNLGLRHGGNDDIVGKPNYYGIMNYFWGWFGGTTLPIRLRQPGVSGRMPDFSESTRPEIDTTHVDERAPQIMPTAWICPGKFGNPIDIRYQFGSGTALVDWNCNGVEGERPYSADLNGSHWSDDSDHVLTGFNDWAPGAMRFDGGGVLGDFELPPRPNPPVEPELSAEDFAGAYQAAKSARKHARKQLVVRSSRGRLKPHRVTKVRVQVRAGGHAVRGAALKVRGARVLHAGSGAPRTDRRGRVLLRLRTRRHGDVRIFAKRRGYLRGGLVVLVARRR
jgi:hypothetical protein